MTIVQLKHFYTLSQFSNFSIAANHLYITQPALSRSIAAIEKELNIQLLNRSTRKVELTPAGKKFALICRDILNTYNNGISSALQLVGEFSGHLHIGLASECMDITGLRLFHKLKQVCPQLQIKPFFFYPHGLLNAFDKGTVDCIIVNATNGWPRSRNLHIQLISSTEKYAVLPINHPLANKKIIRFDELRDESFIVRSYRVSSDEITAVINLGSEARYAPHVTDAVWSVYEIIMRIAMGEGVSVLPKIYQEAAMGMVAFVPLYERPLFTQYLVWRDQGDYLNKILEQLAQELSTSSLA